MTKGGVEASLSMDWVSGGKRHSMNSSVTESPFAQLISTFNMKIRAIMP